MTNDLDPSEAHPNAKEPMLPRDIWVWEGYQILDEPPDDLSGDCEKYTNTEQIIKELEGMKFHRIFGTDTSKILEAGYNQAIQDVIERIKG